MNGRTTDDLPRSAEIADVGLAASPLAMLFVSLAWAGIGVRIATTESRRGHEVRHLLPLGIALGPFLAAYARSTLRRLEETARPIVVRESTASAGGCGLLVLLLGPARHVADVLPMLTRIADPGSTVYVVRPVTFDVARATDDDAGRRLATRELEAAGLFLHELDPGLVLVPGPDVDALRLAGERGADFLAVVDGDPATGRGRVEILATSTAPQVHHR